MATPVQMPALSPTMKEGKITKWVKKEGDKISSGTAIAEVETDKSNLELEAYDDGVLLKILVKEGDAAPVGAPVAWIGKPGEKIDEAAAPAAPKPTEAPKKVEAAPVAQVAKPAAPAAPVAPPPQTNGRVRASPLAKKIAAESGVDLSALAGSGPNGRIVKRDVEQASTKVARAPIAVTKGVRVQPTALPLTSMRKVISQRLTEVKPGVPHFYLTVDLEMDTVLKVREEAKAMEMKVSVNDLVVKAVAMAVRRFPRINQQLDGDKILQLQNVDVGIAVAIEDGLITPIVRDADQKGLAEISAEIRDLADRAKRRALKPEEYTGGSITVSNLGMYGIDEFVAILNPPQAAIIAIGAVTPKPVVRDGQVVVRHIMSATLSGDHRVIDGAVGAEYLKELRSLLEHPLRLLF
jgi:pyruvate dehydrogenase E2 component (dihydrolipoamide acetyltransferase)